MPTNNSMLHYIFARKKQFILVIALSTLSALANIGVAFLLKAIVEAISKANINHMLLLSLLTLVYILLVVFADFIAHYTREKLSKKISYQLKEDIMTKVLTIPVINKEKKSYADYQSLLLSDITTLENNYFSAITLIIYQLLNLLFALIAILYMQALFLPVMLLICLLPVIFPHFTKSKLEDLQTDKSKRRTNYISRLADVLAGFRTIKCYRAEKEYKAYLSSANDTYTKADINLSKTTNLVMSSAYGVGLMIILLTWVAGAFYIKFELLTFSSLVALTKIAETIAGTFQIIGEKYGGLISSLSIRKRLNEILNTTTVHNNEVSFKKIAIKNAKIVKQGKEILRIDKLSLAENDRILLTGLSGAGKSSLLNIIAGFEKAETASFIIDDELQDNDFSLSSAVIMIEQNSHIFDTNIIDNMSMLDRSKQTKATELAKDLKMEQLINDLQQSKEEQTQFSGGEARRIDLARLLLTDISQKIVLLDEPFSGLDKDNIINVTAIINKLQPKILIITAHNEKNYNNLNYNRMITIQNGIINA